MSRHDQDDSAPRSTDPVDYQRLPQPIGAMLKAFADGHTIASHAHPRDQLLYSIKGVMRLRTERASLVVPPDRAAYIPGGLHHTVTMHGRVEMRTLYIAPPIDTPSRSEIRVLAVTPLLRELIDALCRESMIYAPDTRAGLIATLIQLELAQADELSLAVPLPQDPRLQRLCAGILADPADRRTLDRWSEVAGAAPRTLARLFEAELGMGFSTWRQRVRFQRAVEALGRGEPVGRVAQDAGYRSASAFTAAFRRVMGEAPTGRSRNLRKP